MACTARSAPSVALDRASSSSFVDWAGGVVFSGLIEESSTAAVSPSCNCPAEDPASSFPDEQGGEGEDVLRMQELVGSRLPVANGSKVPELRAHESDDRDRVTEQSYGSACNGNAEEKINESCVGDETRVQLMEAADEVAMQVCTLCCPHDHVDALSDEDHAQHDQGSPNVATETNQSQVTNGVDKATSFHDWATSTVFSGLLDKTEGTRPQKAELVRVTSGDKGSPVEKTSFDEDVGDKCGKSPAATTADWDATTSNDIEGECKMTSGIDQEIITFHDWATSTVFSGLFDKSQGARLRKAEPMQDNSGEFLVEKTSPDEDVGDEQGGSPTSTPANLDATASKDIEGECMMTMGDDQGTAFIDWATSTVFSRLLEESKVAMPQKAEGQAAIADNDCAPTDDTQCDETTGLREVQHLLKRKQCAKRLSELNISDDKKGPSDDVRANGQTPPFQEWASGVVFSGLFPNKKEEEQAKPYLEHSLAGGILSEGLSENASAENDGEQNRKQQSLLRRDAEGGDAIITSTDAILSTRKPQEHGSAIDLVEAACDKPGASSNTCNHTALRESSDAQVGSEIGETSFEKWAVGVVFSGLDQETDGLDKSSSIPVCSSRKDVGAQNENIGSTMRSGKSIDIDSSTRTEKSLDSSHIARKRDDFDSSMRSEKSLDIDLSMRSDKSIDFRQAVRRRGRGHVTFREYESFIQSRQSSFLMQSGTNIDVNESSMEFDALFADDPRRSNDIKPEATIEIDKLGNEQIDWGVMEGVEHQNSGGIEGVEATIKMDTLGNGPINGIEGVDSSSKQQLPWMRVEGNAEDPTERKSKPTAQEMDKRIDQRSRTKLAQADRPHRSTSMRGEVKQSVDETLNEPKKSSSFYTIPKLRRVVASKNRREDRVGLVFTDRRHRVLLTQMMSNSPFTNKLAVNDELLVINGHRIKDAYKAAEFIKGTEGALNVTAFRGKRPRESELEMLRLSESDCDDIQLLAQNGMVYIIRVDGRFSRSGKVKPGDILLAVNGITVDSAERATYLLRRGSRRQGRHGKGKAECDFDGLVILLVFSLQKLRYRIVTKKLPDGFPLQWNQDLSECFALLPSGSVRQVLRVQYDGSCKVHSGDALEGIDPETLTTFSEEFTLNFQQSMTELREAIARSVMEGE